MSDITFTQGYGFPRGSKMDYAGYGALVNNRPRRMGVMQAIPSLPEPGVFAPIPALHGFGSEYTFEEDTIEAGPLYGPEYRPELMQQGNNGGLLLGLGALAALFFFTR